MKRAYVLKLVDEQIKALLSAVEALRDDADCDREGHELADGSTDCGIRGEILAEVFDAAAELRRFDLKELPPFADWPIDTLREIAGAYPTVNDERIPYVEIQVDRETWLELQEWVAKP